MDMLVRRMVIMHGMENPDRGMCRDDKAVTYRNSGVERKLGVFSATCIVIANMVGTGIFTTSGIMAAQLPGSGWVILCWLIGALIALAGVLCFAELATRMPEEGA